MHRRIPSYRYGSSRRADEDSDDDPDRTLRALEWTGTGNNRNGYIGQDEQRQAPESDDLFLNLARDGFTPATTDRASTSRPEKRRSRIALPNHRLSMPIPPVSYRQTDGQNDEPLPQTTQMPQSSHFTPRERSTSTTTRPLGDSSRSRYMGGLPRSSPITPRGTTFNSSEVSPASVSPNTTRRRPSITESTTRASAAEMSRRPSVTDRTRKPSITETTLSIPRNQYRQSNLSYSSPRLYNSSPVVSKAIEPNDEVEIPHASTDETESTTSMTAQSTIWDELDDIKQRMRRLEVRGKMPATSGATVSNSSNERPRTATTTATTNSISPKRDRGSSTVSPLDTAMIAMPHTEAHPNLRVALAKSKSLLSRDVYDALEKTANDALTLAGMMGTAGQPGPISSAQSAVGAGTSTVTDRQVRKKADNMCRGLTELCIALNEQKAQELSQAQSKTPSRPTTRGDESQNASPVDVTSTMRKVSDVGGQVLTRLKASPRTIGRLSERTSFFTASPQPTSPALPPSEATTPTQTANAGRRTSLLLRSRRAVTEEPEETEMRISRLRAPSRAVTDVGPIGRSRTSPREYTSNRPLPEVRESLPQPSQSSLPLRRHFISNSVTSSLPTSPATPNGLSRLESRRYLERAANRPTPERDGGNFPETQQLDDNYAQRKISMPMSYGRSDMRRSTSISRRTQVNGTET